MKHSFDRILGYMQMIVITILTVALVAAGSGVAHKKPVQLSAQSRPVVLTATIDTSASTVGIADSDLYFMTADELAVAMEQLQSLGITQIRVFLPWRAIETAYDEYDWAQADLLLDTAAAHGIAVVAGVTSTPVWASDYGGLVANGAPSTSSAYAEFVGALAERYGTTAGGGEAKIAAYEIWNEPNGFTGWYPEPDAELYTELLKAAYTAIKAVDPDATVVAGALGTGITIGSLTVNPVDFLTQMYAAGAAGYFDALSFHPYNYTSMFSEGTAFANSAIKQLTELRQIMDANGDSDLLVWVTEYGQPSSQVSEANQAAYIADFLTTWSELTGVGPAFLYSLIDSATGSSVAEDNLGLFTSDWTAKAVVEVIRAWIAGQPIVVDPGESSAGNGLVELLSAVVKAAQGLVTSIASMIATSFDGVTQFLRGIVDAVSGLISAVTGATGTTDTASTRLIARSQAQSTTTDGSTEDVEGKTADRVDIASRSQASEAVATLPAADVLGTDVVGADVVAEPAVAESTEEPIGGPAVGTPDMAADVPVPATGSSDDAETMHPDAPAGGAPGGREQLIVSDRADAERSPKGARYPELRSPDARPRRHTADTRTDGTADGEAGPSSQDRVRSVNRHPADRVRTEPSPPAHRRQLSGASQADGESGGVSADVVRPRREDPA